jgi:hypothetical protein
MPRKVVEVHRWQIAGAFALLTLSFVFGLWALQSEADSSSKQAELSRREAIQAKQLAAFDHRVQVTISRVRIRQLAVLQETNRVSCASRHLLDLALNHAIVSGLAVSRALEKHPPAGISRMTIERGIAIDVRLLADLKKADCSHVTPLPKAPKVQPRTP